MRPERDLDRLLAGLDPWHQADEWVFAQLPSEQDPG